LTTFFYGLFAEFVNTTKDSKHTAGRKKSPRRAGEMG
jgi:hypothetical protein